MRLEWLHNGGPEQRRALDWLGRQVGEQYRHGSTAVILSEGGELAAVWTWHNFHPGSATIEFSGASTTPRWMTRAILHELFAYAFERTGAQMIATRNDADNRRLHRQLAAFGFARHDIPRLLGRDRDGVIWTLTDDEWRAGRFFMGEPDGQELRRA